MYAEVLDDFEFDPHLYLSGDEEGEIVAKYFSGMEAEVAAARLRSEGIPCFLAGTIGQSITPHIATIVRLHALPADADRARALLAEANMDTHADMPVKSDNAVRYTLIVLGIILGFWLAIRFIILKNEGAF